MTDKLYTYAVACIRSKELSLLTKQDYEGLMACKNYQDCIRLLMDKGWGSKEHDDGEDFITFERKKTWELIRELVEDVSIFDVFLYENDFHNLKAAIKQAYINTDTPNIFISHGTIAPTLFEQAINDHDFTLLPEHMRASAQEAYEVLLHTGDGQLCDLIIDKAALEAIYRAGKSSKNDVLTLYAELKVAVANIKIAIRGCKTKKEVAFYNRAMTTCSSLDKETLIKAALSGEEAIYDYMKTTVYSDAVTELKHSLAAFELWCDNLLMTKIRPQKANPFTISPIAAYILAREGEFKTVRIILSGKLNSLSEESIRERLREAYV